MAEGARAAPEVEAWLCEFQYSVFDHVHTRILKGSNHKFSNMNRLVQHSMRALKNSDWSAMLSDKDG